MGVSVETAPRPAPALGLQSRPPYLAVECTVSTLAASGAAPPLSRDSHTRVTHTSPSGGGGLLCVQPGAQPRYSQRTGERWGQIPAAAAPRMPHACRTTRGTVGSARGARSVRLGHSRERGWKSPGESTRARGVGEVPTLGWARNHAGSAPRVPSPTPHPRVPGERRDAGATLSGSLSFRNKATTPRGDWKRRTTRGN